MQGGFPSNYILNFYIVHFLLVLCGTLQTRTSEGLAT